MDTIDHPGARQGAAGSTHSDKEQLLQEGADMAALKIVHLNYQRKSYEGHAKLFRILSRVRAPPLGSRLQRHAERRRGARPESR